MKMVKIVGYLVLIAYCLFGEIAIVLLFPIAIVGYNIILAIFAIGFGSIEYFERVPTNLMSAELMEEANALKSQKLE